MGRQSAPRNVAIARANTNKGTTPHQPVHRVGNSADTPEKSPRTARTRTPRANAILISPHGKAQLCTGQQAPAINPRNKQAVSAPHARLTSVPEAKRRVLIAHHADLLPEPRPDDDDADYDADNADDAEDADTNAQHHHRRHHHPSFFNNIAVVRRFIPI